MFTGACTEGCVHMLLSELESGLFTPRSSTSRVRGAPHSCAGASCTWLLGACPCSIVHVSAAWVAYVAWIAFNVFVGMHLCCCRAREQGPLVYAGVRQHTCLEGLIEKGYYSNSIIRHSNCMLGGKRPVTNTRCTRSTRKRGGEDMDGEPSVRKRKGAGAQDQTYA